MIKIHPASVHEISPPKISETGILELVPNFYKGQKKQNVAYISVDTRVGEHRKYILCVDPSGALSVQELIPADLDGPQAPATKSLDTVKTAGK